jgi:hypothetical protein
MQFKSQISWFVIKLKSPIILEGESRRQSNVTSNHSQKSLEVGCCCAPNAMPSENMWRTFSTIMNALLQSFLFEILAIIILRVLMKDDREYIGFAPWCKGLKSTHSPLIYSLSPQVSAPQKACLSTRFSKHLGRISFLFLDPGMPNTKIILLWPFLSNN